MKKIFYILSICVMTILQPSCDALDLAPEDYYGAGNFWKEASQPKAFMLGCLLYTSRFLKIIIRKQAQPDSDCKDKRNTDIQTDMPIVCLRQLHISKQYPQMNQIKAITDITAYDQIFIG